VESSSRTRKTLGVIVAIALLVRLAHLLALRHDVLFAFPVFDEDVYLRRAQALASGASVALPWWQPPGLVYALAVILKVFGNNLWWPRLLQIVVSTACVPLAYRLGARLRSERVGLVAAVLVALHGVLVFASAELLPANWIAFFDLLAMVLVVEARARESWRWAAAAGLALGVAAVFSPLILPFVPLAALAVWRPKPVAALALLIATALPIAPVTLQNWLRGGEAVLVSSNGGLNFYLGNNADYRDTFTLRPGRHWDELTTAPDRQGVTTAGGRSKWFYARGFEWVRGSPVRAAGLYLRKLYLFFNGAEIPRDSDVYAARADSPVMRLLLTPPPICLPDALILPLALVGLAFVERRHWPVVALFVVQVLFISAFFVSARHRAPMLPIACVLAAIAAASLSEKAGRAALIGVVLGGIALASLPLWETKLSLAGELWFSRGVAEWFQKHDPAAAAADYQKAIEVDPTDPRAWFELGNVDEQLGKIPDAVAAWTHAAELDPWDVRPRRRAAFALINAGDPAGAAKQLEANIMSKARPERDYAHEHFGVGVIEARAGHYPTALERLGRAAALDRGYFRANATGWLPKLREEHGSPDPSFWRGMADLLQANEEPQAAAAARAYAEQLVR
jgi:4-amino-4-deoxy-L-arabinose transferase-like glycosyltransferase